MICLIYSKLAQAAGCEPQLMHDLGGHYWGWICVINVQQYGWARHQETPNNLGKPEIRIGAPNLSTGHYIPGRII